MSGLCWDKTVDDIFLEFEFKYLSTMLLEVLVFEFDNVILNIALANALLLLELTGGYY